MSNNSLKFHLFVVPSLLEVTYYDIPLTNLKQMLSYVLLKSLHIHQMDIDQKLEGFVLAKDLAVCALSLEKFIVLVDVPAEQNGTLCSHCVF